ncbi:Chaperone protein focC precursor [Serratia quinivorans]|uniref:fimbria/pilus periplasmic chaperone n=1 Tax=Serratia quinivorans TaxID=137545 RepID=UPI002179CC96|nr:fimbria/pilus periplasmic chaperone [Serratia quinivorans]CAI1604248.1 Chaperone protein focC precursor [Serratia quinivorans]
MSLRYCVLFILLSISIQANAGSGVVVGATRVIYQAENKSAALEVKNLSDKENFLIQAWVDDAKQKRSRAFIVTPPLYRLKAGGDNVLRIVRTEEQLPQDRETVQWVNVKSIPSSSDISPDQNVLQIAIKTRLKLFYRPKGLQGKSEDAPGKLSWKHEGNNLRVTNPTAYSVTFASLTVNGKEIKEADIVPPKGGVSYILPATSGVLSIEYQTITDFGGVISAKVIRIG